MNKGKIIVSSGIANTFEWYDYALFGHFAPVIGAKFFPDNDPKVSLLNAFLVFAVGYLMRPIGGIFFGILGDKFGRKTALSASIICMAFPTSLIGIIPTYDSIGITATVLMIIIRMLQGFSMGGALTGSISFVVEHTSAKSRGLTGSISMSSICIGILLGSLVSYLIKQNLTEEAFLDWGWRIPFIIGIFILFAGIYIKFYTQETPMFETIKEQGKIVNSPLKKVLSEHWREMLTSIFINSTGSVIFYLQAIYLAAYLKVNRGFHDGEVSNLLNISYAVMAIVTLISGWASDIIGRRKIFVILLLLIISSSMFLMRSFAEGNFSEIYIAQVILSILAAAYIGPEPALQAELYPTNIRNTALSVSYNTATSIFGGTTPYIIEKLVQSSGSVTVSSYYIIVCALLSLMALHFYKRAV